MYSGKLNRPLKSAPHHFGWDAFMYTKICTEIAWMLLFSSAFIFGYIFWRGIIFRNAFNRSRIFFQSLLHFGQHFKPPDCIWNILSKQDSSFGYSFLNWLFVYFTLCVLFYYCMYSKPCAKVLILLVFWWNTVTYYFGNSSS